METHRAQLAQLLEGAQRLQVAETLDELSGAMLAVAASVVEFDHASYNELDPELGRAFTVFSEQAAQDAIALYLPAFEANMNQHPILEHCIRNPRTQPQRLSDHISQAALHDTGLYQDTYRHVDTEYQSIVPLSMPGHTVVGLALNRKATDFSDGDISSLALLQPLLQRAYDGCRRRTLVRALLQGTPTPALFDRLIDFGLSEREAEICFWIAQGKSNRDIGTLLGISPLTAKKHSENVFRKLGAPGRVEATKRVLRRLLSDG